MNNISVFKTKKILDKTNLDKNFKRKLLILGTIEQIVNIWKLPLQLLFLLIYFIFYFIQIVATTIADKSYALGEIVREMPEITFHKKEDINKMVIAIKDSQKGLTKINPSDII
jgi:hypothetical protein